MKVLLVLGFLLSSVSGVEFCVGHTPECVGRVYQEVTSSDRELTLGSHELTFGDHEMNSGDQRTLSQDMEHHIKNRIIREARGNQLAKQVSETLDFLLVQQGYNKQMRPPGPELDTQPASVQLNLAIRSMGPIDETKGVYSLDCYFRQIWMDKRLRFNTTGVTELSLNWQFLTKIWKPDTVFLNGQRSYLHRITVPNRFIRVSPDGRVSYSQRLTVWAKCPMYLGRFPFDEQTCFLEIGSYGYTAADVTYTWAKSPLSMDEVELAQYNLTHWSHGVRTELTNRKISSGFRNDTVAFLRFDLERQAGFFLMGIYFPLNLVVMCSWVAFWIIKTDVPSRIGLGVTCVLSVTKIWFSGKAKPQIGYATALDIYIIICFFFSFAALAEFGVINFIDTYVKRLKKWEEENPDLALERNRKSRERREIWKMEQKEKKEKLSTTREGSDDKVDFLQKINQFKSTFFCQSNKDHSQEQSENITNNKNIFRVKMWAAYRRLCRYSRWLAVCLRRLRAEEGNLLYEETQYVVDRIDEVSRQIFPCFYFITNIAYWTYYLYIAED